MKKNILLLVGLLLGFQVAFAQSEYKIEPVSMTQEYGEITWKGYGITVNLDDKFVKNGLKDAFKDFGKVTTEKKMWIIDPANVPLMTGAGNLLATYSKVSKTSTQIWISVNQEGDFQDELTKNTLYDLAYKLYEMQVAKELEKEQKAYDKLVKEGESLAKKLEQSKKNVEKGESNLKDSEKNSKKYKADLAKSEVERDQLKSDLDNNSFSGKKKEKAEKSYEKAISQVLSLQKKLTSEEQKQLKARKLIRESEQAIRDYEKEIKDNEEAQQTQKETLDAVKAKQAELVKLKRQ